MLGSPILYLKGMRVLMFQLSGFYYKFLQRELKVCLRGPTSWCKGICEFKSSFKRELKGSTGEPSVM